MRDERRPSSHVQVPRLVPRHTWRARALAPFESMSVVVFPCVGVCGYPVRTECGNACGSQDLHHYRETFFGESGLYALMGLWDMAYVDQGKGLPLTG